MVSHTLAVAGSGSGEVEHEREDEDDYPGPDGIHDQVTGLMDRLVLQAPRRASMTAAHWRRCSASSARPWWVRKRNSWANALTPQFRSSRPDTEGP
jgi:hypothetical protein